jgi:nucleoid DNA-binding protein
MTKRELVVRIASETEISQQKVAAILQKTLDHIITGLANGETIEFRDFGVFEVKVQKSRLGRNPRKPQVTCVIPERRVVKFKAGKIMKASITNR